ncbi:hypothetical protein ZEAMMB73_Zm00001d008978 [Zea mays]|uniref:Uncharacterized protein n=1 Tax=Zea mays TaxID=4577 RepID=A0A1D6FGZ2_MAIZE|nr:hypothetical protein ZEAMMB73_Zm00001d008978 [Zea mays]
MEFVAQVAPVLLTIRLDKTHSITLMHGNGNWQPVSEPMDPLHHQAKYHHRSCMGMETMDLLHHHIQIYQICIHQDNNMGMDKFPLHRPITITMMNWNNITILPTSLSTITMTQTEHVSIVK